MLVNTVIHVTLVIFVGLLLPCSYRVYRGPSIADRLLALDLITTFLISIIVLMALISGEELLVDLGLALAALAFIGTTVTARYIAEGRVF